MTDRLTDDQLREMWRSVFGPQAALNGPLIRFAGKIQDALAGSRDGRPVGSPPRRLWCNECQVYVMSDQIVEPNPVPASAPSRREPPAHWAELAEAVPSRREPSDLAALVTRFLTKYDAVVKSDAYLGFQAMGWLHGVNYAGESWIEELDAVRAALLAGADAPPPEEP